MGKRHPGERTEIEAEVGWSIPDQVWATLVADGRVEDPAGATDVHGVADYLRDLRAGFVGEEQGRVVPRELVQAIRLDERDARRSWALSLLEWRRARERPSVVAFRHDVLGDRLVAADEVAAWVGEHRADEGEPEVLYLCRLRSPPQLPDHHGFVGQVPFEGGGQVVEVNPRQLRYVASNGAWRYETSVTVSPGGVLDELRLLGDALATEHRWEPAAAVDFLLTDGAPVVPSVVVRAAVGGGGGGAVHLRASMRTDPAVVARAFRRARGMWLKKERRGLSDGRYDLAGFVAARPGLSWAQLHERWRRERAADGLPDRRAFKTAAKRALRHLGYDATHLVEPGEGKRGDE